MLQMNYSSTTKPKTCNYAHGGHVHNLLEKAYQPHGIGGDIYNASSALLGKIKNHSENIGNQVRSGINSGVGQIRSRIDSGIGQVRSGINSGIEQLHSGVRQVSEGVPRLINRGSKLAHEVKKYLI